MRCVHERCLRSSFTELVDQVPARVRVTARCRATVAAKVGDDNRSVAKAIAEHHMSGPTAHRPVVAYARKCCDFHSDWNYTLNPANTS